MSRRPTDAWLAASFWEARDRMSATTSPPVDAKEKQFGDSIVVRARELQRLAVIVDGWDMANVFDEASLLIARERTERRRQLQEAICLLKASARPEQVEAMRIVFDAVANRENTA